MKKCHPLGKSISQKPHESSVAEKKLLSPLKLTTGVNWTIHLWLGTTFVAGIAGFLLVPPEIPEKVVD